MAALKAWKIQKRAGIIFTPTKDLKEHLLYEPQSHTLLIFNQAASLKYHLNKDRRQILSLNATMDESLPL